jgi:undecaprenyl-diphosphatase
VKHFRAKNAGLVALAGVGLVWLRRVVLPARPNDAETPRPKRIPEGDVRPSADGAGARIVVNPSSGPALAPSPLDELRDGLPAADIYELGEDDDLQELLKAPEFGTIGAAGGDGTLAAAAAIAVERDALLVAVPAGTLNHLARDLGLTSATDAIEAVRAGYAACIDLGTVGDRIFVNTLSFGGYTAVVDRRERLQRWMGKWPALVVALIRELPRMEPLRLTIDGDRCDVWLGWIGNGAYSPPGLAPAWREKLDDGLLDVRLVHGGPRYARTRFVFSALIGRLSSLSVYSERRVESLEVVCLDGPQRLAADGETFDGPAEFTVGKRRRALRVALPPSE